MLVELWLVRIMSGRGATWCYVLPPVVACRFAALSLRA